MGVVVRRYIDILIIIINFTYSTCISSFFGSSIPTSLFILKMFFIPYLHYNSSFDCCISTIVLSFSMCKSNHQNCTCTRLLIHSKYVPQFILFPLTAISLLFEDLLKKADRIGVRLKAICPRVPKYFLISTYSALSFALVEYLGAKTLQSMAYDNL